MYSCGVRKRDYNYIYGMYVQSQRQCYTHIYSINYTTGSLGEIQKLLF